MKFKKSMTLILVASMLVGSLASCGSKTTSNAGTVDLDKYADMDYDEASAAIYNDVLGEFLHRISGSEGRDQRIREICKDGCCRSKAP